MGCVSSQPEAQKPLRTESSFPQKTQNHGTSYHPPASAPNVQTAFGKDAYQVVGQLGTGRNGTMKLMKNKKTKLLVAAKWVPRTQGGGLSKNTEREIVNHRKLVHPHIIRFHEVRLAGPRLASLRLAVLHDVLVCAKADHRPGLACQRGP